MLPYVWSICHRPPLMSKGNSYSEVCAPMYATVKLFPRLFCSANWNVYASGWHFHMHKKRWWECDSFPLSMAAQGHCISKFSARGAGCFPRNLTVVGVLTEEFFHKRETFYKSSRAKQILETLQNLDRKVLCTVLEARELVNIRINSFKFFFK